MDAKTTSGNAVADVEMPHRVPYGFLALFVTGFTVCLECTNKEKKIKEIRRDERVNS